MSSTKGLITSKCFAQILFCLIFGHWPKKYYSVLTQASFEYWPEGILTTKNVENSYVHIQKINYLCTYRFTVSNSLIFENKSALIGCYSIWIFIAKSWKKCTDLYRGHWLPIETIDNNESHELWDSFLFKTPTVQWTIGDKVIVCKSRGELSLLVKYTHLCL